MMRRRELMMLGGGLPGEYRKVEYLESTGTQYINLQHTPNTAFHVSLVFASNKAAGDTFESLLGAMLNPSTINKISAIIISANDTVRIVSSPPSGQQFDVALPSIAYVNAKITHDLDFGSGDFTVGAYSVTGQPITNSPGCSVYVLARNTANSADYFARGRLYKLECWDSSNYHINLLPCVRKADNKPGMYDTVSRTFYTNAGTGEFIVPN